VVVARSRCNRQPSQLLRLLCLLLQLCQLLL
jgi:hypothetical protein